MKKGLVGLVVAAIVAACAAPDTAEVVVSAAASLDSVFAALEESFEDAYPGVDVVRNVGSSSLLRYQIVEGAPVDVYASADHVYMDLVEAEGLIESGPTIFAVNRMVIAVPSGNPGGITGLDDFTRSDLLLGLCAPEVPCGALAREVLNAAAVTPDVDTNEPDVRALLTKIEAGELDGGIVYASDVAVRGGAVEGIEIDRRHNVGVGYPIAVIAQGESRDYARLFVDHVLSAESRAVLTRFGFGTP